MRVVSVSLMNLLPYTFSGRVFNHEMTRGQRVKLSGSMYTIPHLETVAGEATSKSATSNIMVIWGVSWMI
jgi:uncharacterized Zn finger protein